ncbi:MULTISPECIES: ABC transporter ATP-binding protein [Bombella]|uniref:Nitrate/sulfonate/bicarbonate ABC transporter ATP-binding protein n=1 Tax=Bombella pollinis TaxID=2967337 RepID=A0ABT3WKJ7_9PROT|nr:MULTISPECIES: nitrate/sulfonate/bicarbonate ABC transporter ATP-binding protein [Bombella]MCT6855645.1 nitrate/sulfonate/bicarbonate ABC transporter ATP-binding protein [Bombella apis]MCX5619203.1 nitrate/sulfonate/bicarbonate ABC transporter ATP-binding protein [Bombella pollinis]MUG04677.1 ATP-binding cassette domain-containing protein [Bombella sp. ESL0378]PHI95226.1 nitrate ABC transporter ATP-binding protein [Parasaccharibacter apium]
MNTLLRLVDCTQVAQKARNQDLPIVEQINMEVQEGEILGLVGRSGSGKSSLLKIMAGLEQPKTGTVFWKDDKATPLALEGVSIILQDDVLFPWLTVRENILLALEAKRQPKAEREKIASAIIEVLDMDGYEGAYPRELSDALAERTSLTRALARQPEILLLDEPFLNIDHLSAENLRTDLIELWQEHRLGPLKAMVLATHAIEEAVLMCDRILLFSSGPGRITHEIRVPFPHPRNRHDEQFRHFVDQIYTLMTLRAPSVSEAEAMPSAEIQDESELFLVLPDLSIEMLVGLMEALEHAPHSGRADLPELAQHLQMTLDDLFPLGETLQLLDFADLEDGDIILTQTGRTFVEADADARRDIMRAALLHAVPLLKLIRGTLDERNSHAIDADVFRRRLEESMSISFARQTLNTAISWARYANLFDYDEETDRILLESEE